MPKTVQPLYRLALCENFVSSSPLLCAREGPCPEPGSCRLMPASMAHRCRPPTELRLAAVCDGSSYVCQPAVHRPDYTECQSVRGSEESVRGSGVCLSGLRQDSVCLKTGLEGCGLTPATLRRHSAVRGAVLAAGGSRFPLPAPGVPR